MQPRLDAFIIGKQTSISPASAPEADLGIRLIDARIPDAKSPQAFVAQLNQLVAGSTADLCCFVNAPREFSPDDFVRATSTLADRSETVACFCVGKDAEAGWPWGDLPTPIAALLCRPSERTNIIFRRQAIETVGPLRDVAAPGWDWLIRAARKNLRFCWADKLDFESHDPTGDELQELAPKPPAESRNWLRTHLQQVQLRELLPTGTDATDVTALHAGLFQWHDYLDDCHELCQTVEGEGRHQLADYWHAIMHRREPDYSNAKYWFRRIGRQPLFPHLTVIADALLKECPGTQAAQWYTRLIARGTWDPCLFVDLCETCESLEDDLAICVRKIQEAEMRLLLQFCYRQAAGIWA